MIHKVLRSFTSLLLALAFSLTAFSPALAAPPANDNFIEADVIPSLPFSSTVDITEATNELSEPQPCHLLMDRTVWYSFTPIQNMWVRPDISGGAVSSIVNVYHSVAPGINNLNFLNCAESFGDSRLFYAEAGQQYYLQVGSISGEVGNIQLNLEEVPPPANDNFADARAIEFLPGSGAISLDIHTATNEMSEPENCFFMDKTVWFSFTPTQNMVVHVSAQGDGISSNVNVYHSVAPGINNLNFLQCATFGNSGTLFAEAGQKYYLQFGSIYGEVGNIQLTLQGFLAPANDNFADVEPINSLPFITAVDVSGAGIEPGENRFCSVEERTVWYSFMPTQDMMVRADTLGSFNGGSVSIHQALGPDISDLSFLGCATDSQSFTFLAEAEQTYYFKVGTVYSGQLGTIQFNLTQIFPPSNDSFANAINITSLPFSATADITDATTETGEQQWCSYMDRTVWYSFTPTESMVVVANAADGAISTNVNIYRAGSGISDLQVLSCTGADTFTTFIAEANQTYYLQAGSASGEVGYIRIDLDQFPPPANDNFANATPVSDLPFDDSVDTISATLEGVEPTPSCDFGQTDRTVWYAFTPDTSGLISANFNFTNFNAVMAAYTGTTLVNLNEVGCRIFGNALTFQATANTTYYFQVGGIFGDGGPVGFHLEVTPPPAANFYYYPGDPSKYDTIQFCSSTYDPGNIGIESFTWDFGDGATATEDCSTHRYTADGDYTVQHTVTTFDGRTAAATPQVVQVRTHDVAITKITAPNSANSGQTKSITVTLRNKAYPETVQVDLYKSTPEGFVWVATVTKAVPALSGNRTTTINFNYMFTSDDARIGKVTFRAVATIIGARDALPIDNEAISSPPSKVSR